MDNPRADNSDIDSLLQQADLYETQGLYEHAMQVYRSILNRDPDNDEVKDRISKIRETEKMGDTTVRQALTAESLSPRLAFDLGVAYMGMNLYAEALEEFTQAAKTAPENRAELMRYSTVCLIHLERFKEARRVLDRIISDGTLTPGERGDIVSEALDVYISKELNSLAGNLLERVPDDLKEFIRDYDRISSEIGPSSEQRFELEVEDTETGEIYREPLEDDSTTSRKGVVSRTTAPESRPAIPLRAAVSYSLDSKKWMDGVSVEVSADWAVLQVPEPIEPGDSLVVQIHLPTEGDGETVSVISKVAESGKDSSDGGLAAVKVRFVSFLPGGEATLRSFINRAVLDPSYLDTVLQSTASDGSGRNSDTFSALQEQAVKELEEDLLTTIQSVTSSGGINRGVGPSSGLSAAVQRQLGLADTPKIRFACECGQIHVVPVKNCGRKGKCGNCGKMMTVPVVDTRPDSLTESVVGKIVGGCRLLYKLGGGGMGGVFKGHHIALDIPVAVKILHAHLAEKDPVFIKRFIREARAAARLQHPNIVGVMNVGFENGLHFIVMPFVGGGSAAAGLARQGRLPVDKVLDIAHDVVQALIVAEENNMLHRDIKPANILFTDKGEATLADLGLAKNYLDSNDSGITQTGIACGTPLYFSPEQAKGSKNLDIRSDIYSLGITLYHLLNGSPPFKGESAYVIFQKHVHEPLPPFDVVPPIPDTILQFLKKMTEKNPADRFAGAVELAKALEELRAELVGDQEGRLLPATRKGLLARLGIKKS
ncbi:MAG: protein kinase [Pseudomonadota bacterium]